MKPYSEDKLTNEVSIRTFKNDTHSDDFVWHRDREDRIIESIGDTNWMLQMDNELPKIINENIFIRCGVYHRIIKGSGDLKLKITKLFILFIIGLSF